MAGRYTCLLSFAENTFDLNKLAAKSRGNIQVHLLDVANDAQVVSGTIKR